MFGYCIYPSMKNVFIMRPVNKNYTWRLRIWKVINLFPQKTFPFIHIIFFFLISNLILKLNEVNNYIVQYLRIITNIGWDTYQTTTFLGRSVLLLTAPKYKLFPDTTVPHPSSWDTTVPPVTRILYFAISSPSSNVASTCRWSFSSGKHLWPWKLSSHLWQHEYINYHMFTCNKWE